ncbi:NAD-dependent protein deacetylase Sirt6 [Hypsibius exemplaris]|uniref:protein acetyllysine N-acetyltransferase n=1 Tax=Hypsibius exemplaris TaxID=2072580 RepID=A0A1W0WUD2_HYPEX|nr:NAD-dependent protein deacetylase Sirt6 [Hypsibius exemplaris]
MSQNYAAGLSKYKHKGVLGLKEIYDNDAEMKRKVLELSKLMQSAKHVVLHTGAGISTAAGISDFRGPKGIWTAEKKKQKPAPSKPFSEAIPTFTHMAIMELVRTGTVKFVISQNIDGLHIRSGLSMDHLAELHGNIFMEECPKCHTRMLRKSPAPTIARKKTGGVCGTTGKRATPCRGELIDNVLDWCSPLPETDLSSSEAHSRAADLNIVLGSTMQINPSGELPLKAKARDPNSKFVICNLQKTKFDDDADLVIRAKVDDIFRGVMEHLALSVGDYKPEQDPVLAISCERIPLSRNLVQPPVELLPQPKVNKRKTTLKSEPPQQDKKKLKVEPKDDGAMNEIEIDPKPEPTLF